MGTFAPFADGELIPAPVRTALTGGDAGSDMALLLGSTAHEFNVLPEQTETPPLPELLGFLGADPGRAETFRAAYEYLGPDGCLGQALTDATFRAPAPAVADARASRQRPTWLYEFTWTSPANGAAYHCLDLPFVFDLLDAEGVAEAAGAAPPQVRTDAVHRAWVAFVRDLDPGKEWPRYETDERATVIWSADPHVADDPLRHVRDIWIP
jgi:para-nitrobenzyl esterase